MPGIVLRRGDLERERKAWQPTPVLLPRESHGQRSLAGYSPRGRKELDATERLSTHEKLYAKMFTLPPL